MDDRRRTSLPDVFVVGDCAVHVNAYAAGAKVGGESVQNANDQANVVAKTIAGIDASYDALLWF